MTRLESVEPLQHLDEGVLHQIDGVERAARRCRQPAMSPPMEAGQIARAQFFAGSHVPVVGTTNQRERRLGSNAHPSRKGVRRGDG